MGIKYIKSRIKSCAKEGKRSYTYFSESGADIDFITAIGKEFSNGGFWQKHKTQTMGQHQKFLGKKVLDKLNKNGLQYNDFALRGDFVANFYFNGLKR